MTSKGKNIALWIISGLLAAMFVMVGGRKLANPAEVAQMFAHFGYTSWFAAVIGIAELGGGLLLLIPRVAPLAAAWLSVVMLGAIVTHIRVGEWNRVLVPLALLCLLIVVGLGRRQKN